MKTKPIPKKLIASRLLKLKIALLSEHAQMLYDHVDAHYMRTRAKEEIMTGGNLDTVIMLLALADIKNESQNSKK